MKATPPVTGLGGADTALVGIDFRAKDGLLYGVGNGAACIRSTRPAPSPRSCRSSLKRSQATDFGVDFNPAADRLRVVSDTGQNLRQPGRRCHDRRHVPEERRCDRPGVTSSAYHQHDLDMNTGPRSRHRHDVDQVAIQSPPNNGNMIATGKLVADAGTAADSTSTGLQQRRRADQLGLCVLTVDGVPTFYSINC